MNKMQKNPLIEKIKNFSNGGKIITYKDNDAKNKNDFKQIKTIAQIIASQGGIVEILPRYHFKSNEYQQIYSELKETKYWRKCPDLKINDQWYEFEGFLKPWTKNKIGRMLAHGLKQSSKIIIDNTNGCSHRYLRKRINDYLRIGMLIDEVIVYERGKLITIYKKSGKQ